MNDEIRKILDKFDKKLENYDLDKKFGQLSVDSIGHLFPSEMKTIKDCITNLQQENERLKEVIQKNDKDIDNLCKNQKKEIERLNNIINGMEKFFKYEFDNEVRPLGSYKVSVWTICLDKLKALKEGKE